MSDSLLNDATGLVRQLLGQSRYRLDVHGCTEFLDVLKFSSVETLSQPWRFDISVTSSSPVKGTTCKKGFTSFVSHPDEAEVELNVLEQDSLFIG